MQKAKFFKQNLFWAIKNNRKYFFVSKLRMSKVRVRSSTRGPVGKSA